MGRPYLDELHELPATYALALKSPAVSVVMDALKKHFKLPIIFVGSGGAYSAARFMAAAYEAGAQKPARLVTPLEIILNPGLSAHSLTVIVSASGNNKDISAAFQSVCQFEGASVLILCANKSGKIVTASVGKQNVTCAIVPMGGKKDGFLAVNSVLSFSSVFAGACTGVYSLTPPPRTFDDLIAPASFDEMFTTADKKLWDARVICFLHGLPAVAAAVDFESKATESGLIATLLSDLRNFGHGRHHWLAKNPDSSAVIAFSSQSDKKLTLATLKLIPNQINKLHLHFPGEFLQSSLAALVNTFFLIYQCGKSRSIDPGRPGVPGFGSKIYSLGPKLIQYSRPIHFSTALAVERKMNALGCDISHKDSIHAACILAIAELRKSPYAGVALDYDGTIVGRGSRFDKIPSDVGSQLNDILHRGGHVTVCTGRGKSVHERLRECIENKYWKKVVTCFYNGGSHCLLSEEPIGARAKISQQEQDLVRVNLEAALARLLTHFKKIDAEFIINKRDFQLSIESKTIQVQSLCAIVNSILLDPQFATLKCLRSYHSLDIIPRSSSKLNAEKITRDLFNISKEYSFLNIGDMPEWPGNDCEFLSQKTGVSVGASSSSLLGGWNFTASPTGYDRSLLEYLQMFNGKNGSFSFNIASREINNENR